MSDDLIEGLAEALHEVTCRDNPGHAEWEGCAETGPCAQEATRLAAAEARAEVAERQVAAAGLDRLHDRLMRVTEHRDVRQYGEEGTPFSNGAKRMAVAVRAEFEALFRDLRAALDTAADPDTPTPTRERA